MKRLVIALAIALLAVNFGSCSNGSATGNENKSSLNSAVPAPSIQILYFHGDRRCATCIKVGEVSLNLYNSKYATNTSVAYKEVNIDKEENKAIAEKYQIAGSSLIIDVKGVVTNITVDAFKYANADPSKLESLIAEIIEKGLKE